MLKVLVAPLDWGLGHATRCIPIVKELINQNCTVFIAAGSAQKAVLQDEFPSLSFVEMTGFRVKYGKNRAFTLLKILFQIPKILIGIKRENQWLRRFARLEGLDLVISDNRFGLHSGGLVSVFITHQLAIRSSFGGLVDGWLRKMNYNFIRRFSVCWVPDVEGAASLAGKLSHPARMPAVPVRYIGWLSRLELGATAPGVSQEEGIDLLILLSGPEPQRTILERLLLAQLSGEMGRIAVVRGLATGGAAAEAPAKVLVFDYLGARDLERVICQSRLIVARPGYSTVMDLAKLRRRAIFVPTPGQPEQEYLGKYLEGKRLGICVNQRGFSLKEAVEKANTLKGGSIPDQTAGPVLDQTGGSTPDQTGGLALREEIARVLAMARTARMATVAEV